MSHKLKYRVLNQTLAVCKCGRGAPIPAPAPNSEFYCVTRTTTELSIVCPENNIGANPDGIAVERGWRAVKLEGPFPFSLTGVLASFLQPLSAAKIAIFAVSTFDTDYVLIKEVDLQPALRALESAGHELVGEGTPS